MPLKKRGLGKGLDAIFAENTAESTEGAVNVKISEIEPNREQPARSLTVRPSPSWRTPSPSTGCSSPTLR